MKYYAIRKGRKENIVVTSWDECSKLVTGFPKSVFKSFEGWQYDEAAEFAQKGVYKNQSQAKPKIKTNPIAKPNKPWGKCLERKSYNDPFTGEYFKNRCVVKFFAETIGIDYVESTDTSCPF